MAREFKSEAHVKAAIKKLLTDAGWFWWMPPANAYGRAGISDFHALKDGRFLAIEAKFGSNTPTAMQIEFLKSVALHDGRYLVVNEKNLDALDELLHSK